MELSEQQFKVAEALALRSPGESLMDVAKRAGVSKATLWRYRQEDGFCEAVRQRIRDITWADRGPVIRALTNKVLEGDVPAIRLWLQWRGELVEKSEVDLNTGVTVVVGKQWVPDERGEVE